MIPQKNIIKPHVNWGIFGRTTSEKFNIKGFKKCQDNDLVILSDVDEIPDLKKLNIFNKNKYAVFSQKMFMYKLNLLNTGENNWHGSKICLKKKYEISSMVKKFKI